MKLGITVRQTDDYCRMYSYGTVPSSLGDLPPLTGGGRPLGLAPLKKIPPLPKPEAKRTDPEPEVGEGERSRAAASSLGPEASGKQPQAASLPSEKMRGEGERGKQTAGQERDQVRVGYNKKKVK